MLGLVAGALSVRAARDETRRRDEQAGEFAASRVAGSLDRTAAALRGADALATDGRVDPERFAAFAHDVLENSLYTALASVVVVEESDRPQFEATSGLTIRDTDGAGGFVPSPDRNRHLVVTDVFPRNDGTEAVLGFDISSDPARAAAAERAAVVGEPVISDPINLAGDGSPGLFFTHRLDDPRGNTIGFVSSGVAIERVLAAARLDEVAADEFRLKMDGYTLAGGASGDVPEIPFKVAGRSFTMAASAGERTDSHVLPLAIGVGAMAFAVIAFLLARRERAQVVQRERVSEQYRLIAELGRELAGAQESREVLAHASTRIAGIMDAAQATIATWGETGSLAYAGPGRVDTWFEHQPTIERSRDERSPLWTTSSTKRRVLCVPMVAPDQTAIGVLCVSWSDGHMSRVRPDQESAATTVAELVSGALVRTMFGDVVRTSAESLNALSQDLARAQRPAQVGRAVERRVPTILRARSARLLLGDDAGDTAAAAVDGSTVVRQLVENDVQLGSLVVTRLDATSTTPLETQVIDTIVELVEQTLSRSLRADEEHRTILQLQRSVLGRVAELEDLDVAVRYVPAMLAVGLGGDFYDVVVSDGGRRYVVVGDVSGHGPEAVVVMAELKAVLEQFLRSDNELGEVFRHADSVLARRGTFATALVAEIDVERQRLVVLNAGHPFPILRSGERPAQQITSGHRRLLGLREPDPQAVGPAVVPFLPDDLLVLYTDGLIERKGEPIDEAMERLSALVDDGGLDSVNVFADRLVAMRQDSDEELIDDVALLLVRHAPSSPATSESADPHVSETVKRGRSVV